LSPGPNVAVVEQPTTSMRVTDPAIGVYSILDGDSSPWAANTRHLLADVVVEARPKLTAMTSRVLLASLLAGVGLAVGFSVSLTYQPGATVLTAILAMLLIWIAV